MKRSEDPLLINFAFQNNVALDGHIAALYIARGGTYFGRTSQTKVLVN